MEVESASKTSQHTIQCKKPGDYHMTLSSRIQRLKIVNKSSALRNYNHAGYTICIRNNFCTQMSPAVSLSLTQYTLHINGLSPAICTSWHTDLWYTAVYHTYYWPHSIVPLLGETNKYAITSYYKHKSPDVTTPPQLGFQVRSWILRLKLEQTLPVITWKSF